MHSNIEHESDIRYQFGRILRKSREAAGVSLSRISHDLLVPIAIVVNIEAGDPFPAEHDATYFETLVQYLKYVESTSSTLS